MTDSQIAQIIRMCAETGTDPTTLAAYLRVNHVADMPFAQARTILFRKAQQQAEEGRHNHAPLVKCLACYRSKRCRSLRGAHRAQTQEASNPRLIIDAQQEK